MKLESRVGVGERKLVDSGVTWIGKIPEGWPIKRIAALYDLRSEKCSDKEFRPLSVTMKGVVPQLEDVAKTNNGDDRKLVRVGDFVINSRSDRRGSCGISPMDGSVSLINTVLRPRGEMDPGYYNWVFHSPLFADEFYAWGHGIVDDLWTTRWSDMKSILVMFPPLAEQQRISAFLDRECEKIDGLRGKIEKQIEKLDELKKSTITEAVMKGGDEWRLKHLLDRPLQYGASEVGLEYDEKLPRYIRITDVTKDGVLKYEGMQSLSEEVANPYLLKDGDILLARSGATVGKAFLYKADYGRAAFAGYMIRCSVNRSIALPKFVYYTMQTSVYDHWKLSTATQATIQNIGADKYNELRILLPPLAEQKEIAEYLDKKCAAIDAAKEKCRVQLDKLAEYKKSLIYEYVTGKREVA